VDWSKIDNIRAEWPIESLNPSADLQRWQQALVLYERDDYSTMMQCANLFATALAHSLYGEGILRGDDLPETVHKALYCSLCPPPDRQTFADSAQKAARLALTIMRENAWQPPSLGGTMTFFERMIMDTGNYMLLRTAIGPTGRPLDEGDLLAFFSVAPAPVVPQFPDPHADEGGLVVNRMYDTLQQAKAGDPASEYYINGMALWTNGRADEALAALTEAAKLGSIQAMKDAGDLTSEMGRPQEARFWFESAANAGDSASMWNMAVLALQERDLATAARWYQMSAEAGVVDGYAALTQLADEAGDEAAEEHWARLGTEAGQSFCMTRYGLLLARSANGDVPTLRRARDVVEQAAERGEIESMALAVSLNHQLGDTSRSRRFADMVVQSGDAEAIDRLRRYGLL